MRNAGSSSSPAVVINHLCCISFQFLLLLGCFSLFWSLYYTLEVTLAHLDLRGLLCLRKRRGGHWSRRGRRGRGVEEAVVEEEEEDKEEEERNSGMEMNTIRDAEAKVPLFSGEVVAT